MNEFIGYCSICNCQYLPNEYGLELVLTYKSGKQRRRKKFGLCPSCMFELFSLGSDTLSAKLESLNLPAVALRVERLN